MIIVKKEYHQLTSTFTYDVDDDEIEAVFGSLEAFFEHFEEESDEFQEFMSECDYDRDDDLWTDRKGGYDVEWELSDD